MQQLRHPFSPHIARTLASFLNLPEELIVARLKQLNIVDLFDLVITRTGYQEYSLSGIGGEKR